MATSSVSLAPLLSQPLLAESAPVAQAEPEALLFLVPVALLVAAAELDLACRKLRFDHRAILCYVMALQRTVQIDADRLVLPRSAQQLATRKTRHNINRIRMEKIGKGFVAAVLLWSSPGPPGCWMFGYRYSSTAGREGCVCYG